MSGPILFCVLAATSTTVLHVELDEIVAGRGPLPALAAVQDAAERALELASRAEAEGWSSRARTRALLPTLDARVGTDSDLDQRVGTSASGDFVRVGRGLGFDISAHFLLGELVFNDVELRASRERIARGAALRLARERATRLYFMRVKVLLDLRQRVTPELLLEAARLDGLLRAVTGGLLAGPVEEGS